MVSIVHEAVQSKRRLLVDKVLEILDGLLSWELSYRLAEIQSLRGRATRGYLQDVDADNEAKITRLNSLIAGIHAHKRAISDFLLFRAANRAVLEESWTWTVGQAVPTGRNSTSTADVLIEEIPHQFRCPISHELLEDPVIAGDDLTYERNAIVRWFQIRLSSPLTGLELARESV